MGNDGIGLLDSFGQSEKTTSEWQYSIEKQRSLDQHINPNSPNKFDDLWGETIQAYFLVDPESDFCWDCEDDMKSILKAMYLNYSSGGQVFDRDGDKTLGHAQNFVRDTAFTGLGDTDGSIISHFMGGAVYGKIAQNLWEAYGRYGNSDDDSPPPAHRIIDTRQDNAAAYLGDEFYDWIDSMSDADCRCAMRKFKTGTVKFSDMLGNRQQWDDIRSGKLSASDFAESQIKHVKEILKCD